MKLLFDLHTHTVASGHAFSTLKENIEEAAAKGLKAMGMSDRILVISNHRLSGELSREEFSQDVIMKMAMRYM